MCFYPGVGGTESQLLKLLSETYIACFLRTPKLLPLEFSPKTLATNISACGVITGCGQTAERMSPESRAAGGSSHSAPQGGRGLF